MSQALIRAALKASPDGLTVTRISNRTGKPRENTRRQIEMMPDVYICQWVDAPPRSPVPYVPVYAVVQLPVNAPRPY